MRSSSAIMAVLWDMDGTLIDSEKFWMAAERELAEEHGGNWAPGLGNRLVGLNLFDAAAILKQEFEITGASDQQIIDRMTDAVVRKLTDSIPWRPGVVELMAELSQRGVRSALVTGSMGRMARLVASQVPEGNFEVVIAGDDVIHGKPHAEPYLRALSVLGLAPEQCIAIEDSPTGMQSAEAAGLRVIGVTNIVELKPGKQSRIVPTLLGLGLTDLEQLW